MYWQYYDNMIQDNSQDVLQDYTTRGVIKHISPAADKQQWTNKDLKRDKEAISYSIGTLGACLRWSFWKGKVDASGGA